MTKNEQSYLQVHIRKSKGKTFTNKIAIGWPPLYEQRKEIYVEGASICCATIETSTRWKNSIVLNL